MANDRRAQHYEHSKKVLVFTTGVRAYYAGGSTLSGGGGGGPSTEADTARAPFYTNGNNRCAFSGSVDDHGGWCDPFNGGSAATDWDTSMVAGLSGEKTYLTFV